MIDWGAGYSASWRVMIVDPDTWQDSEEMPYISSASVERDCTDDCPLLESGTFQLDAPPDWELPECWCRIEMLADQGGERERHAIATLLAQSSSGKAERGRLSVQAYGRSVLQPASDRKLLAGTYAPKGANGGEYAASLLRQCTPAPVVVEGKFTLDDHVVFDAGSSYLEAAWAVLKAADWRMRVSGDGTISIGPKPDTPVLELDRAHASLLVPGVDESWDVSEVPNRYCAVEGDAYAIAQNDNPDSPISVPSRGRYVDVVDSSVTRVNGETLEAYAQRRLAEESVITRERTYTREWWPDVSPFDVVRGSLSSAGLDGDMRVLTQSLECGKGIAVTEKAGKEESWL